MILGDCGDYSGNQSLPGTSIAKNKSYSNCLSERKDSRRNLNFAKAVENGKDLGVVHSMNRKRFIEITFQGILILILK